jgi:hypothetical protein
VVDVQPLEHGGHHIEEENRVPLSVVIVEGTPNREIQPAMRSFMHFEVYRFYPSCSSVDDGQYNARQ